MVVTYTETVFTAIFSIILLGLAFFGNSIGTYFLYGGIATFCVFYLAYARDLSWTSIGTYKNYIFLWLIFIASLIVSSFFSQSPMLSVGPVIKYIFLSISFLFFLLLPAQKIRPTVLVLSMAVIVFVLLAITFINILVPGVGSLLPAMNLVYSTYGHNHLNAVLILFYPLAIWSAVQTKQKIGLIATLLITLGLIVSFGRTAIVIAALQLLTMGVLYFRKNVFSAQRKNIAYIYILVFTGILISLLAYLLISFSSSKFVLGDKSICFNVVPSRYEGNLCKDLAEEQRIFYWRQAVEGFSQYPLLGYGPGTFKLISSKYRQFSQLNTLYAHNDYLQALSEWGILGGGVFIFLMMYLLYEAIKKNLIVENHDWQTNFKIPLIIGIVSMYINVFFDYDWQFLTTLLLTLICLAIVLKSEKSPDKKIKTEFAMRTKILFLLAAIFIAIYSIGAFVYIAFFTAHQQIKSNLILPFINTNISAYLLNSDLTLKQKNELLSLYKNHSEVYVLVKNTNDPADRAVLREHLLIIDPWQYFDLKQEGPFSETEAALVTTQAKYLLARIQGTRFDKEWVTEEMGISIYKIAEAAVAKEQIELGLQLYADSLLFWPLNLHQRRLSYSLTNPSAEVCSFLEKISVYPDTAFGSNQKYYAEAYVNCLEQYPTEVNVEKMVKKVHDLDGSIAHTYWSTYSQNQNLTSKQLLVDGNLSEADAVIAAWYQLWRITEKEGWEVSYDTELLLAQNLVSLGTAKNRDNPFPDNANFLQAQEVIPSITLPSVEK